MVKLKEKQRQREELKSGTYSPFTWLFMRSSNVFYVHQWVEWNSYGEEKELQNQKTRV